jgi:hypothetical protein
LYKGMAREKSNYLTSPPISRNNSPMHFTRAGAKWTP